MNVCLQPIYTEIKILKFETLFTKTKSSVNLKNKKQTLFYLTNLTKKYLFWSSPKCFQKGRSELFVQHVVNHKVPHRVRGQEQKRDKKPFSPHRNARVLFHLQVKANVVVNCGRQTKGKGDRHQYQNESHLFFQCKAFSAFSFELFGFLIAFVKTA